MKKKQSKSSHCKVNQLTSLREEEYKKLLSAFDKGVKKSIKYYMLKGIRRKYVRNRESLNYDELEIDIGCVPFLLDLGFLGVDE